MKFLIILFAITSTIIFDSCLKKGEDDPCISLRSRKARVVGDWEVISYKYVRNLNLYALNISNEIYTMDGSTYTSVYTDENGTTTKNGTETWKWTFRKDGTFDYTCTIDGQTKTSNGFWKFLGETKAESQIICDENIETGCFINCRYNLKELRNKKMIWTYEGSSSYMNDKESMEVEIIFKAK
ncbi:MAG: hypothetical protein WC868_02595 [Bacteroidales bacterium]